MSRARGAQERRGWVGQSASDGAGENENDGETSNVLPLDHNNFISGYNYELCFTRQLSMRFA